MAAPATQLSVSFCPVAPPTCLPPPGVAYRVGQPFSFFVLALDAFGNLATNYTGTVSITSIDPAAKLPSPYTYTAADASARLFNITINSLPAGGGNPALVAVTASDTLGLTGTSSFEVFAGQPATAIAAPMLSTTIMLWLVAFVGLISLIRLRRNWPR